MPQFSVITEINVDNIQCGIDNIYHLSTSDRDLLNLAERFSWVAVENLEIELCVHEVAGDSWNVTGHISANIIQNCIVTGVPVLESIDFEVEERYVRVADNVNSVEVHLNGAEPLKNGAIDIGELAVQSLGLAATSWPREENAPSQFSTGNQELENPFAELSALKRQNQK